MIDAVNVVDIYYCLVKDKGVYMIKLAVCWAYQKRLGTRLWNVKKKGKGKLGGVVLQTPQ